MFSYVVKDGEKINIGRKKKGRYKKEIAVGMMQAMMKKTTTMMRLLIVMTMWCKREKMKKLKKM